MVTKAQEAILNGARKSFDKLVGEAKRLKERNPQQHLDFLAAYDTMVKELREKYEDSTSI